jgi:hypothetical protein
MQLDSRLEDSAKKLLLETTVEHSLVGCVVRIHFSRLGSECLHSADILEALKRCLGHGLLGRLDLFLSRHHLAHEELGHEQHDKHTSKGDSCQGG